MGRQTILKQSVTGMHISRWSPQMTTKHTDKQDLLKIDKVSK